jgi:hypothetical protein
VGLPPPRWMELLSWNCWGKPTFLTFHSSESSACPVFALGDCYLDRPASMLRRG